jgi:hypothetical protein
MSLPQEASKVANTIVDALRAQPMVLAVLVFNALILGIILWGVSANRTHQAEILKAIIDQNKQLIDRCFDRRGAAADEIPLPRPRPASLPLPPLPALPPKSP